MQKGSFRIWRSPDSDFYSDETLRAVEVYTPGCLCKIADAGLEVSGIASSINVCVPEARERNLEEAKRAGSGLSGFCEVVRLA